MKLPARALAVTVVTAALLLGIAGPAAATVQPAPVVTALDDPLGDDYWGASELASKSGWRAKMLNITGSLLGSAMPNSWQAELAANNYMASRSNANLGLSEEQFNAMMGNRNFSPDANGNVQQISHGQGTYDDYVLKEHQAQQNGGGNSKPVRAPATTADKWGKAFGGATLAPLAFTTGTQLGGAGTNLVGGFFGFDANGTVCGQTSTMGFLGQSLNFLSGQNCDQWMLDKEYKENADIGEPTWYGSAGALSVSGYFNGGANSGYAIYVQTTHGTNASIAAQGSDGNWYYVGIATPERKGIYPSGQAQPRTAFAQPGYAFCHRYPTASGTKGTQTQMCGRNPSTNQIDAVTPKLSETDPKRTLSCSVRYADGTRSEIVGAEYRESEKEIKAPNCPATPVGKVPTEVTVTENSPNGAIPLSTQPTTPAYQDWVKDFPECGTGACLLDLLVKTAPDKYASCFDLADGCVDWFTKPDKADTYVCRYGVQTVALSECNVYSGLFQPGRVEVGAPYSNPMTGEWSGGKNSPTIDEQAMGQTIRNPDAPNRKCTGMNIQGFDPVGFVMRPVQCALEWAFVPRPTVVALGTAKAESAWESSYPGKLGTTVTAAGRELESLTDGNCGGVLVPYPALADGGSIETKNARFLAACDGDFFAPWAPVFKAMIGIAIIVAGYFGIRRLTSRFVGF